MKANKPFFFFLLILMGFLPLSCDLFCFDECACGRLPTPRNFVIDTMTAGVLANNQVVDPTQPYAVDDLIIRILVDEVTYANASTHTKSFSFFSAAFACDPIPPGSAHPLKAIKILSNSALEWKDQAISSGEEITELFRVAGFGSDTSFESLIRYRFNFLEAMPLDIRLKEQPEKETTFDITLELTLSDNRIFKFEDLRFIVF
ncbi:MAG: hypothetical protein ACXIUD_02750 [Mongoliitalea sp.]